MTGPKDEHGAGPWSHRYSYRQPEKKETGIFIWAAAIICAILTAAVIIVGIAVFIGYVIIHPRVPFISVTSASLDRFQSDQSGILVTQVTIDIKAENDNAKAHASFQDMNFLLSFGGMVIANLQAAPFDVRKNDSIVLHYVVESSPIPLDPERTELASESLRQNQVSFDLKGNTRARWRVGPLGSLKFWCHLNCRLNFHLQNSSFTNTRRCSSRAK